MMEKLKEKRVAIYPGSFDPITLGHVDIIHRLQKLYDELIVVVANSEAKNYLFSDDERVALIRENVQRLENVRIDKCEGLTVEYARQVGASVMIRGLRAVSDFEYEFAMANMNKQLAPDIETLIVFTSPQYSYVASRMVKEVGHHGGDLSGLVPDNVIRAMQAKWNLKK